MLCTAARGGLVNKHGFFNNFPIYAQLKLFKPLNEYARLLHQVWWVFNAIRAANMPPLWCQNAVLTDFFNCAYRGKLLTVESGGGGNKVSG